MEITLDWRARLFEIAATQHGLVDRSQVRSLAPSGSSAAHELSSRRWEQLTPRVHRSTTAPRTPRQRLMVGLLDTGPDAVVSHRSAASLWGITGQPLLPAHVTRRRDTIGREVADVCLHQVRRLPVVQTTVLDGFPITRPERVPFDLANLGEPEGRVERIVDRLWADRLVTFRSLRFVLLSLPRRGFRGTAMMRRILDARGPDWVPPASGLESRFATLLERSGLPAYERQVDLGDDTGWIGRVDFVQREDRVVVEVQSERHHAALSDQRNDASRRNRLERAGFRVIEVWERDLWSRPDDLLTQLDDIHRRAHVRRYHRRHRTP